MDMKLSELIAVNRQHRQRDDSDKWPVSAASMSPNGRSGKRGSSARSTREISADEYTRLLDTLSPAL